MTRRNSLTTRTAAVVAAVGAAATLALANPLSASAATTPALPSFSLPVTLTFVPPSVGAITVDIGATIIGGKVISPGIHIEMPPIVSAPITWTVPAWPPAQ